jgi:asparagine synthase (glutamine-hydrolysing)
MCGIFGFVSHSSDVVPEKDRLRETANLMQHRGPDARGFYVEPGIALVHTRLSLLDLSERGNQPFWDKENRYALIYNGEIYNFKELRDELTAEGVTFETTCDTEVLLKGLLKWGADVTLPKLEGMFAFALFDREEKSLLLTRDRFGIKPLFIYETDEEFVFASEIRTMRPWIDFEADPFSISSFLYGFSGPTQGATFFRHITCVEPGGIVRLRKGGRSERSRFFALGDFIDCEEIERLQQESTRVLIDRVDELLNASVQAQLVADAPVGALCSGGLDSSIVMAIAAKYHSNLAIFHANVVGPVSEFEAASRLAKHLKLDLKSIEVHDHDFIDRIPEVTEHFGHPFYSCPHSVPYHAVCQLVRQNNVKAVLSGEAADEYFLGYHFFAPNVLSYARPREALRMIKRLLKRAPAADPYQYKGPGYIQAGDAISEQGLVQALHNRFEVLRETFAVRDRLPKNSDWNTYRAALPSVDSLGYNLRALLHRNDTMGMASSVEARFPFLDTRLARLAINMPLQTKIRFSWKAREDASHYLFQNKWVLRKVGERYLPNELFRRAKRPFPINAYAGSRLKIDSQYFSDSAFSEMFDLGRNDTAWMMEKCPHNLKFKLVLFEVWAQLYLKNASCEAVLAKLRNHLEVINPGYAGFLS